MLSTVHTLISLPFAFYLESPWIIFLAAFVFHLLADTLLHWNIFPKDFKRYPTVLVALDVLGGVVIAGLLLGDQLLTISVIAAIAGGNAPDVLHGLWDLLSPAKKQRLPAPLRAWFIFHENLQLETTSPTRGLITQVLLVVLSLGLIVTQ